MESRHLALHFARQQLFFRSHSGAGLLSDCCRDRRVHNGFHRAQEFLGIQGNSLDLPVEASAQVRSGGLKTLYSDSNPKAGQVTTGAAGAEEPKEP